MYGENNEARKSVRTGETMGDCAAGLQAEVDQPSGRSDILNDVQSDWARALYAKGSRSLNEFGQSSPEGVGLKNTVMLF